MPHPGPGRPKGDPKVLALQIELRREKAVKLRVRGYEYREIAKALGCALGIAHKDVHAVLARTRKQADDEVEAIRQLELERLDHYLVALHPKIAAGSAQAIDAAVRIAQRRAKLLGLDAPEQVESRVDAKVSGYSPSDIAQAVNQQFGSKGPFAELATEADAPPDAK